MATMETANSQQRATIYVRNYAKKAIMLHLPIKVKLMELKARICERMRIPVEYQRLFLQGESFHNDDQLIKLENKLIFHLVNTSRTDLESITISVKRIEPNSPVYQFALNPKIKVKEFMCNQLAQVLDDVDSYFLVYTGRELELDNNFVEELVEDESEILAIHKVENLKEEIIEHRSPKKVHTTKENMTKLKQEGKGEGNLNSKKDDDKNQESHEEEEVNRSSENIARGNEDREKEGMQEKENEKGKSNVDENNDDDETEDIVIDFQQKYSVISKDSQNFNENTKPKKMLSSQNYGMPVRQPNRRRRNSAEPERVSEEQYKPHYCSESDQDHSESHQSPHLGLTVISSRHDEQESLNDSMFRSGWAKKSHVSNIKDSDIREVIDEEEEKNSLEPVKISQLQEEREQEGEGEEQKKGEEKRQQRQDKSQEPRIDEKEEKTIQYSGDHQKQEAKNEKNENEENSFDLERDKKEKYGRTNIFEYIDEDELLPKSQQIPKKSQILYKSAKQEEVLNDDNFFGEHLCEDAFLSQNTPKEHLKQSREGQQEQIKGQGSGGQGQQQQEQGQEEGQGQVQGQEEGQRQGEGQKNNRKRSNTSKSNNSDSLLLETSQDVNEDNVFAGKLTWGNIKNENGNEKGSIDLSAQLQEETGPNEIVPGGRHWQQLSFSFRNSKELELKPGDLLMLADDNSLKLENYQEDILKQFMEKLIPHLPQQ